MKTASILSPGTAHWYEFTTGRPCYEIPRKGGPLKSKMKVPDLRDARRLGLVKSVTSIIRDMWPAPGLVNYKLRELYDKVRQSPIREGETEDDYFRRLCSLAADDAALAADVGIRLHDAIDAHETGQFQAAPDDILPMLNNYCRWREGHIKKVIESEGYIPAALGYGGRFDMLAETPLGLALIDFKTKRTKPGERIFRGDEWGMQLAAYAQAKDLPAETLLWDVAISTTEPARIEIVDYTDSREKWTAIFNHLLEAWFKWKEFYPCLGSKQP